MQLGMIGGEATVVEHLDPLFVSLAPRIGDIPRPPGRERANGTAEQGYLHQNQLLSAMRYQFGGHMEQAAHEVIV